MPGAGGTAAGKARARARNNTRSGSSGISAVAAEMLRTDFDEIEDVAVHVNDMACIVQSGQIMANRAVGLTLVMPREYAHEATEAALQTQGLATFVRLYTVPLEAVLPGRDDNGDDDGDE